MYLCVRVLLPTRAMESFMPCPASRFLNLTLYLGVQSIFVSEASLLFLTVDYYSMVWTPLTHSQFRAAVNIPVVRSGHAYVRIPVSCRPRIRIAGSKTVYTLTAMPDCPPGKWYQLTVPSALYVDACFST